MNALALADPERVTAAGVSDMSGLARLACERYGLPPDAALHLYPLTENWTYRVEPPGGSPAVLRIYRPGNRSPGAILSELAWMAALRDSAGALVPEVLRTTAGNLVVALVRDEPEPPCYGVLFSCAPGREPAEDELAAWFPRLGAITARLHQHARSWRQPPWFSRPRWDLRTTLGDTPHWGPWHSSVPDPGQRAQLSRLAEVVTGRLRRFGAGTARFGLVHADLRLANLLVEGDQITVIDFEDCGLSWYLYDLACALTFNEGRADVAELVSLWVRGYREVEPLPPADEREIETFLMLRRLMLTAYAGLRHDTELAAQMRADGYNEVSCALAESYLSRFG